MIRLTRVSPLTTLQDSGRTGHLAAGISASGPMDRAGFAEAGTLLGAAGSAGIEFTLAGLALEALEPIRLGFAGAEFIIAINGRRRGWPGVARLAAGDRLEITPGPSGTFGYLRFEREVAVAPVLGSRSTNLTVGLGGLEGRALRAGDEIRFSDKGLPAPTGVSKPPAEGPIRIVWGLHAGLFPDAIRQRFVSEAFRLSPRIDRMGARLDDPAGVFAGRPSLTLVSDAIVAGDIQILGDGTPIVLLRDHQPTGGYPRIATVISADIDRFVQQRPGSDILFSPVTVGHAQGR